MSPTTLRRQLASAAMLTTLVALLLSAGSLLAYEWFTYRAAWASDLRSQAELIAHASSAALVFDDPRSAEENLALLRHRPSIVEGALFLPDGSRIAHYLARGEAAEFDRLPTGLMPGRVRFDGPVVALAYGVQHDGEPVGRLVLRARHDVAARAGTYALIEAGVVAAALAVAALVFGRLQQRVTAPLAGMTDVARQVIERRDWRLRTPRAETQDLAALADAFNGVLAEVEARTSELEREMVERRAAEAGLRDADRRKDEFLATLAHELRNPLAPMSNAIALLALPNASPSMRERSVAILARQLRHLVRLIDDLLDVSRITTGKLSLQCEPLDLVPLARSAIELTEPLAAGAGVALAERLPDSPCWVHGDAARLSQVLLNLLSNACRYTPRGGHVAVEMRRDVDSVEVAVVDDGIGIEPAMQQRVFELFEQADKRLERGNTGLGIGLTLARQLARLHGGDISLHSEGLNRGSRFAVRLPTVAPPPSPRAVPVDSDCASPPARPAARARHVLIADDNADLTASLSAVLEAAGHRVTVALDGERALAAALREPPDVAVLDVGMPGLNGFDLARHLREQPSTRATELIAVTGWGEPAARERAAAAGFAHHLVKPVEPQRLLDLIDRHGDPR